MQNQQGATSAKPATGGTVFLVVSCYLIGNFLYCLLTVAHEYPMRFEQLVSMGIDLIMTLSLFKLKPSDSQGIILFWLALVAGIGLFAIRMTSDAAWWTGHLLYSLD